MTERQTLLEEAGSLGLTFAKNAKTINIQKAVNQAKEDIITEEAFVEAGGEVEEKTAALTEDEIRAQIEKEYAAKMVMEKAKMQANLEVNMAVKSDEAMDNRVSIGQAKLKARREAMSLKRVVVTCKDPMKSSWEGEIISAGNDIIGEVKKYIPFNIDEGYHVPQIILNVLASKNCTVFVNKKGADGKMLKTGKQVKAYSIDYMEPLSTEELTELARDQSARGATDTE